MSISELIEDWTQPGGGRELTRLLPALRDDPVERTMFVTPEIEQLFCPPWADEIEEDRCMRLRADLEAFVRGQTIGVCMMPGRGREHDRMAILDPPIDGIWDIRSVDPKPGIRVLGGFLAKDVFAALIWRPRSEPWRGREPLLAGKSEAWRAAILETRAAWRRLFFSYPPLVGESPDDFLSGYIVGRPLAGRRAV